MGIKGWDTELHGGLAQSPPTLNSGHKSYGYVMPAARPREVVQRRGVHAWLPSGSVDGHVRDHWGMRAGRRQAGRQRGRGLGPELPGKTDVPRQRMKWNNDLIRSVAGNRLLVAKMGCSGLAAVYREIGTVPSLFISSLSMCLSLFPEAVSCWTGAYWCAKDVGTYGTRAGTDAGVLNIPETIKIPFHLPRLD